MDSMEEERRLAYVGITRAKQRLYMVYAFRRTLYGITQTNGPSRFIADVPSELATGRDKFALVVHASRAEKVMETAQRIFSDAINDFYTPADSKQGHIVTINRQGALTKSGLCALRFDVVRNGK